MLNSAGALSLIGASGVGWCIRRWKLNIPCGHVPIWNLKGIVWFILT